MRGIFTALAKFLLKFVLDKKLKSNIGGILLQQNLIIYSVIFPHKLYMKSPGFDFKTGQGSLFHTEKW